MRGLFRGVISLDSGDGIGILGSPLRGDGGVCLNPSIFRLDLYK